MLEHEVTVSDFETTADILQSIGLVEKFQEEKRRIRWHLNGVEVNIDEMPLIRPAPRYPDATSAAEAVLVASNRLTLSRTRGILWVWLL